MLLPLANLTNTKTLLDSTTSILKVSLHRIRSHPSPLVRIKGVILLDIREVLVYKYNTAARWNKKS
ncbi:hypothetical protein BDM02DRAFT_3111742 [Thelephora ganbajun]|uniref:Uncharacterized protein n=1 Tax=Thelephora ganbajun TaxID=370292 RepID=A0ACB6ZMR9_THEGA|nr:hypothetical protein BDM02DRAFT_3111742 [Thelephora ganbajun]